MGKRKSRSQPQPAKKSAQKLDTVFNCPFCCNRDGVECKIDWKKKIGVASCMFCKEDFSTTVNALTEPIDIYSEWIDACERVNNRKVRPVKKRH